MSSSIVNLAESAREDAKSHAATDHWLSERIVDWSGLTVAHNRPTYFAEWLLYLALMMRPAAHVPFGTGNTPDRRPDQGRVIASILEGTRTHEAESTRCSGRSNTYQGDQVAGRVLGKNVQYKQIDFDEFSKTLQASGKSAGRENSFLFQHLKEVAIDHQNGIFAFSSRSGRSSAAVDDRSRRSSAARIGLVEALARRRAVPAGRLPVFQAVSRPGGDRGGSLSTTEVA